MTGSVTGRGGPGLLARARASVEGGAWILRISYRSRVNDERERTFVARASALDLAYGIIAHHVARVEGVAPSEVIVCLTVEDN